MSNEIVKSTREKVPERRGARKMRGWKNARLQAIVDCMRKTLLLLSLTIAAAAAAAQSPSAVAFRVHDGIGFSMDYPMEWLVTGVEMRGASIFIFAQDQTELDALDFLGLDEQVESGKPFALYAALSPEIAAEFGFSWKEREDALASVEEILGMEPKGTRRESAAIGITDGVLSTGPCGENGTSSAYIVTAKAADGSFTLFIAAAPAAQAREYAAVFKLMHESIAVKETPAPTQAGSQGYDRLACGGASIDYPRGWNPMWLQIGDANLKAAMFLQSQPTIVFLQEMDFPPSQLTGSFACLFIVSGEFARSMTESGSLEVVLEGMVASLGTEPQVLEREAAVLNGVDGRRMTARLTGKDGKKSGAFVCISLDTAGETMYVFLGLSPIQSFTADRKKFEAMAGSFTDTP
jgi:hypothetical protein